MNTGITDWIANNPLQYTPFSVWLQNATAHLSDSEFWALAFFVSFFAPMLLMGLIRLVWMGIVHFTSPEARKRRYATRFAKSEKLRKALLLQGLFKK